MGGGRTRGGTGGGRTRKGIRGRRIRGAALALLLALTAPACGGSDGPGDAATAPARRADLPFSHPGVLVSKAQLDRVRAHVAAREQPWRTAYEQLRASKYAAADYRPKPYAVVACPPGNEPGQGCVEEREDALAAYTQALLYNVTGDRAHAEKAIAIMDAWARVVTRHTEANAGLQTAWAATSWARAAEAVRYTYDGWADGDLLRFERMLRNAYLPQVVAGSVESNGNWDLVMADAVIGMAVFLDDHAAFEEAVRHFRGRVPAYFYLKSDGPLPVAPRGSDLDTAAELSRYWFGQKKFADGLAQETCRNFKHAGYSLAATAHIAETAWHQGVDLYAEVKDRLRAAFEFHSGYQLGATAPGWLCGGRLQRDLGPDTEVGLNHLRGRLGMDLPNTRKLTLERRPEGTDDLFVAWETLTHAENT
ncbi:alginate lyase family protein [Streptomyces sp. MNP-20]|uniref:alginate lyase family protein n=1 Tax=Streptomyces sp. MNP-20 TaxID=2721165 RepID=UPI00155591FC|nr:alginate lyase family protein [Streptomyces sp. MNP-20]